MCGSLRRVLRLDRVLFAQERVHISDPSGVREAGATGHIGQLPSSLAPSRAGLREALTPVLSTSAGPGGKPLPASSAPGDRLFQVSPYLPDCHAVPPQEAWPGTGEPLGGLWCCPCALTASGVVWSTLVLVLCGGAPRTPGRGVLLSLFLAPPLGSTGPPQPAGATCTFSQAHDGAEIGSQSFAFPGESSCPVVAPLTRHVGTTQNTTAPLLGTGARRPLLRTELMLCSSKSDGS